MGYQWPVRKKSFNKYNAVRSNGFGSKLESAVYQLLLLRQKAGEIKDINQQVSVDLTCGIRWKVDFSYYEKRLKKTAWVEAKGCETERYRMCLKLWRGGHGPGTLLIYKGSYVKPTLVDIVVPRALERIYTRK